MEPAKGKPKAFEPRKVGRPSMWRVLWEKVKHAVWSPTMLKGALLAAAAYLSFVVTR